MPIKAELIAPCGMNCGICLAHIRDRATCPGCRIENTSKSPSRFRCVIVNCEHIRQSESGFCYGCPKYPCARLKRLDMRYKTKYGMSMLENLEYIRDYGPEAFVYKETERWRCPECGATFCVHRPDCIECGTHRSGAAAWPANRDTT